MYRDGFEAALEAYEQERARVLAREQELDDDVRNELPAKLFARLEAERAKLSPAEDTIDAVRASENALVAYERTLATLVDLSAQVRSARARRETIRFTAAGVPLFGSRRWLMAVVMVALLVAFGLAPQRLLAWAKESSDDCLASIQDARTGDPSSCRERLLLAWPLAVPWTHIDAWEEWRSTRRDVVELQLQAAFHDQNVARRDEVVAAMLAEPARHRHGLLSSGAFERLAAATIPSLTALRAAAVVGDVAAIERHASGLGGYEVLPHLARGAWLCLLGKSPRGLGAIAHAERIRALSNSGAGLEPQLAAIACGGDRDAVGFDPLHVASYARAPLHALLLADPTWQRGRRAAVGTEVLADGRSLRHGAAAILATSERALTWREALRFTGTRGPLIARPWALVTIGKPTSPRMLAPSIHAQAARNLADWSEEAPEENPECATRHDVTTCIERPRAALAAASRWAWHRTAMAHTRLGHRDAALKALRAAETPDGERWRVAGLQILLGDQATALTWLEAADMEAFRDGDHGAWNVLRGYALAGSGRIAEAHAVVGSDQTAPALKAALLRHAGKPVASGTARAPTNAFHRHAPEVEAGDVARWTATLEAEPAVRARARFAMPPHSFDSLKAAPAIFDLVGAIADDPAFVEPWLDHVFSRWHLESPDAAWLARARAEAARWRGDDASAQRWDARADVLFALLERPSKQVLMTVAAGVER